MCFAELLYIFIFSPSHENKLSAHQLPHNCIVSPLTQFVFQIPRKKLNTEKTENSTFEITNMWET